MDSGDDLERRAAKVRELTVNAKIPNLRRANLRRLQLSSLPAPPPIEDLDGYLERGRTFRAKTETVRALGEAETASAAASAPGW
jgi:hypothetical protein